MRILILKDKDQVTRYTDVESRLIEQISTLPIGIYTEIILDKTLDLLEYKERNEVLLSLVPKLRYNGLITIIGTDYYELGRQIVLQNISSDKDLSEIFKINNSITTIHLLEADLVGKGLKIETKGLEGLEYIVSGKKEFKK